MTSTSSPGFLLSSALTSALFLILLANFSHSPMLLLALFSYSFPLFFFLPVGSSLSPGSLSPIFLLATSGEVPPDSAELLPCFLMLLLLTSPARWARRPPYYLHSASLPLLFSFRSLPIPGARTTSLFHAPTSLSSPTVPTLLQAPFSALLLMVRHCRASVCCSASRAPRRVPKRLHVLFPYSKPASRTIDFAF